MTADARLLSALGRWLERLEQGGRTRPGLRGAAPTAALSGRSATVIRAAVIRPSLLQRSRSSPAIRGAGAYSRRRRRRGRGGRHQPPTGISRPWVAAACASSPARIMWGDDDQRRYG